MASSLPRQPYEGLSAAKTVKAGLPCQVSSVLTSQVSETWLLVWGPWTGLATYIIWLPDSKAAGFIRV